MKTSPRAIAWLLAGLTLATTLGARAQDAPTTGQILVLTEPAGARIFVDGQDAGTSPVTVPALVPGAHLVVAIAADGARAERVVEVEAGRSILVQLAPPAPPAPPPTSVPAPAESTPAPSVEASAPAAPVVTTPAPAAEGAHELAAADLGSTSAAPSEHVETEPIAATGFPGLLGTGLGLRLDVPIYVQNPLQGRLDPTCADPRTCRSSSTPATARLTFEASLDPAFSLLVAIDLGNGAFGLGAAVNLPGWIPLVREIAIALQPRLQALVYYHPGGAVLLSAETTLGVGFAPIPHLVIGVELGAIVLGALPFQGGGPVVEGAYVGPIVGGGVQWAFY